ncbi:hypothetical protein ROZALSC1DRAFT_25205, partial [Rozella allomycis CSF55]
TIELNSKKVEINNLRNDLQKRQDRLEKENKQRKEAKNRLEQATDKTVSLESKAASLQDILKQDEEKFKGLEKEIKNLREIQFKKTQQVFQFRKDEQDLTAEISGAEATIKNWHSKISKLEDQIQKQLELIYNQDFQIQLLERKIRKVKGEKSEEEKEVLNEKIKELTLALAESKKKHSLLSQQYKKSLDEIRRFTKQYENLLKERKGVEQALDDITLYNDSAQRQLVSKIKEKEEFMVEENLLRLELQRLRTFLSSRADQVYSLEARQVQLQLALEERQKEIDLNQEITKSQIKFAQEEKQQVKLQIREKNAKIQKLKNKYDVLIAKINSDEEEHSQAYYVIKASQRREELQREGDALDAKIRKAEAEIKALENTLNLLNTRNSKYRNTLTMPDSNSEEVKQKMILEQQIKSAVDKLQSKKSDLEKIQKEIEGLDSSLQIYHQEESNLSSSIDELQSKLDSLIKDIEDQEARKQRSTLLIKKYSKNDL